MKKFFSEKRFNIIYSIAAIFLMWAVWLIAEAAVKNDGFIAPFGKSAKEFFALFSNGFFWKSVFASLLRTVTAFILSFISALGCACLAVAFKPFAAFMRPVTAFFRTLPTMAVLLLILVWLTPLTAPVAVSMLVLFPMIYSQLSDRIGGVDSELLQMAKVYKLSAGKRLLNIYLPHVAPLAVEQTGANISFGLKLIVSAEVMASTYAALGGMISEAQTYINLPRMAALTLACVALGIMCEWLFRLISRIAFRKIRSAEND